MSEHFYGVNDRVDGGASCGDKVILRGTPRVRELGIKSGTRGTYAYAYAGNLDDCVVSVDGVARPMSPSDFRRDYDVMWLVKSAAVVSGGVKWLATPSACVYYCNAAKEAHERRMSGAQNVHIEETR
jgi:hypothetical protein